jgi:surface antigen
MVSLTLLVAFFIPSPAQAGEQDCRSAGYVCTPGYTGANAATTWAWKYYGGSHAQTSNGYHNCTLYVAWRLARNGMPDPGRSFGNAIDWAARIGGGNRTPAVGAIAWWGSSRGRYGHVAYVEQVSGSQVLVRADNWTPNAGYTSAGWIPASSVEQFLHPHDVPSGPRATDYVGTIVQWDGDKKAQKTSWLVRPDGRRYWIPSGAEYWCWRQLSAGDKGPQPAWILDRIIPDSRQTARCPAINGPTSRDVLRPGQSLRIDQRLWSQNGRYTLLLQGDRNFVLYGPGGALWATNRYTGDFVIMQNDCNVVAYNIWGAPAWASNTGGLGDGCALVVQNDSNLVVYNRYGRPVWDRHRGRLV